MTEIMDALRDFSRHLPGGDVEIVRNGVSGMWDVAIYEPGTTFRTTTVAREMDRSVAMLLKTALLAARAP